jgi:hypothetical protein
MELKTIKYIDILDFFVNERNNGFDSGIRILELIYNIFKYNENISLTNLILRQLSNALLLQQITVDMEQLTIKKSINTCYKTNENSKKLYLDNVGFFNRVSKLLENKIQKYKVI